MQEQSSAKIREIFTSIQGEGTHLGEEHIFVRFSKCNLNCNFCDTDFDITKAKIYSTESLYKYLFSLSPLTVSFTGGEPLLDVDFLYNFLKEYKQKLSKKIYLETNGTLHNELSKVIDFVDIVSMDIKLKSAAGEENKFYQNEQFLKISSIKETFVKVVFDKNIRDEEIKDVTSIVKKFNIPLILQPKMPIDGDLNLIEIFNKFCGLYSNIRLIPQMHKFLNLA